MTNIYLGNTLVKIENSLAEIAEALQKLVEQGEQAKEDGRKIPRGWTKEMWDHYNNVTTEED